MPDRLSIHAPILVNTIGHSAGAIIFGILLYLLFNDWRRNPGVKPVLPSVAAALALVWNLGSLVGLATGPKSGFFADFIIAASFSVLSFLPAVLLHISAAESKLLVMAGYVVSSIAAVLHFVDLFTGVARYHYAAILLITIGFGVLTAAVLIRRGRSGHLAGAMALFLFAISFAHFGSHLGAQNGSHAWSGEIALHHCGIPLALFVLLRDYRFLLLDTFIRFLVNACLAAAAVGVLVVFGTRFDPLREIGIEPFYAGLVFVGACVLLILFGSVRRRVQELVTRSLFLRANPDQVSLQLQQLGASANEEETFLLRSGELIAGFIGCDRFAWGSSEKAWMEIAFPVMFAQGDSRVLSLGARRGGRMFLSEDVAALERLLLEVSRQVDRLRAVEMQALVVKGELQALQAQINPHFLFNTLNTIYGVIPRTNALARSLILNLSEILRYALSKEQALIPVEDEVHTVRAYLEIEQARLGPRLHTEISVDERAAHVEIPAFSIQPLVENAVKFGAAAQPGNAYVKLTIDAEGDAVRVMVANSGGFPGASESRGNGLALNNVRRRLDICYGAAAHFRIEGDAENTQVRFEVPLPCVSAH
jgi:two-component system LytT family sensor kinase